MRQIIVRVLVVVLGLVGLMVAAQCLLTRDDRPEARIILHAEELPVGTSPRRWTFTIAENGWQFLDGEPSSVTACMEEVRGTTNPLTIEAQDARSRVLWRFVRDDQSRTSLDGAPCTLEQLHARLARLVASETAARTRPVTVQDLLDAQVPCPTVRKVSLPGFSYRDAYPGATDEPEVVIKSYHGHPMFDDPNHMPDRLAEYYPDLLPPVAERLPVDPAVIRGCDGIGKYSTKDKPMIWRRCGYDDIYLLQSKIGYPALLRFDPSGRLQPHIAWKWEASEDNRVFTFYLRKGMKWSDGKPYTTEDILFVMNTLIGSSAESQAPDWLQETDGMNMIYAEDVRDWVRLAARIREEARSARPSPGRQLFKIIDADESGKLKALGEMLERIASGRPPTEDERYKVLGGLNSALSNQVFYDPAAWQGVDFKAELEALRAKGYSRLSKEEAARFEQLLLREDWLRHTDDLGDTGYWKPGDVTQFNVLMFRAAYRDLVAPARRERCKVEAVPDGNGDARYILRFTFKKPSAIFLETVATFMCYWGRFTLQKAHRERYLPEGYSKLDIPDILGWKKLLKGMKDAAAEPTPSPGKHIWSLLSAQVRAKLEERLPAEDRGEDEEYKREIVEELNRLFGRRDFYEPGAWSAVDLTSELSRLMGKGYGALQTRERRRVMELIERRDLARRGVSNLSNQELFDLNLAMFRVAFDGDPKLEEGERDAGKLVAPNREDALDKLAQWRGFRTWLALWRESGKYNREWNRHVPTVLPWRIVSEADDMKVIAVRNPYYFKVDVEGNQLPYIDMIESEKTERKQIRMLKMQSGNVDYFARETEWADFTALKLKEEAAGYEVRLWANDYCGELIFIFCQQHGDPEYRELAADPRFRQALSLALNRQEMIDIVWQGMGKPAQCSVPKGSPYYNPRWQTAYVEYDPDRANRLLDEMGLDKRASDGTRLLPSGRPLVFEVSTEQERPLEAVQLACNYWREVGVNALMKVRQGLIKWRLFDMGKYDVWAYKEGISYFGPLYAGYIAPTHQAESVGYSRWAYWLKTGGRFGEEPPDRIKELDRMWNRVVTAPNEQAKIAAWMALTDRAAEELPVIGVSTSPGKVIYLKKNFKNVPKLALAGWIAHDPGNCNPEVFYIDQDE